MENKIEKQKCPKCGSENIHISRDTVTYRMESVCQNCGKAWYSKKEIKKAFIILGVALGFVALIVFIALLLAL